MRFNLSFNKKWLIYALSFFLFFAGVLLVSEYLHERKIRIEALNEELSNYSDIINRYLTSNGIYESGEYSELDSLVKLINKETLRITVIDISGKVLFDSEVSNTESMENHAQRPEVQSALHNKYGTNIRVSKTTGIKYYYYAHRYYNNLIRVSVVYDVDTRKVLKPDQLFLLFVMLVLFMTAITVVLITNKYGKSISTLREFTMKASANKPIDEELVFPENELGLIGQDIIDIYQKLNKTKEELVSEKAKLIRHLNILDEGIAIFSRDMTVITNNNHFIQYINLISDRLVFSADEFFHIQDFSMIFSFIEKYVHDEETDLVNIQPTYEITVSKNAKYYSVRSIVFQDRTFEVSINDVTKPTKRKLLKQQMTENIAHELKTPVSSIKGLLETILNSEPDKDIALDFLNRAYSQATRLANLVNDISLLTKIEEAGSLYAIEQVNLSELITDIAGEIKSRLEAHHIKLELSIPENLIIKGNPALLYSIFRNLFDNAIHHGGNNLRIKLTIYMEDSKYYYFSFSDNGTGVPAEDLPRLFERFYRVDKGRDRKNGGTGLGLSIVKNAIQFHKGDISAKNRKNGGLEFLFALSKEM
jgi:two-component system phosphate regulon sensor histidine kinase PhoR